MQEIEKRLSEMSAAGASDMLLTVGACPQLRVLGNLRAVGEASLTAEDTSRIAWSLLNTSQRDLLEKKRSIDFSRNFAGLGRFRFNVYYQRESLAVAIRLIPEVIPSFEELGLPGILRDFALRPHGLVLVTGPAGSGKSTTLAAMIDHINTQRHVHIICIEDPIEYLHVHRAGIVDQREVFTDTPSFSEALHSVFRQSPDVIMIGEMRDMETMQLALTLAETGHLILATLHTQDTSHAIHRIVDVFPPAHQRQVYTQLSMVLSGVVSQALLMSLDLTKRVLACEVMTVNNAIRNLIREHQLQQVYSVIQTSRDQGMMTMNESLKGLVAQGAIDQMQALERSPRPRELARMLGLPTNGIAAFDSGEATEPLNGSRRSIFASAGYGE